MRRALFGVIGAYALYAVEAIFLHPTFIYPFDQTSFSQDGYEQHVVEGVRLAESEGAGPAVLYLMGNAGALALFPRTLALHHDAGRHVVALEYPGGGGHPGFPSEDLIKAQALIAHDYLAERSGGRVIVHGYSLGSSVALYVASEREVAGVMLDAPFARMCEQMARQSKLPACQLPGVQKWDSLALAGRVMAPVMIQHGARDMLALPDDGRRLANRLGAEGVPVDYHLLEGATHVTLIDDAGYAPRIAAFIAVQAAE